MNKSRKLAILSTVLCIAIVVGSFTTVRAEGWHWWDPCTYYTHINGNYVSGNVYDLQYQAFEDYIRYGYSRYVEYANSWFGYSWLEQWFDCRAIIEVEYFDNCGDDPTDVRWECMGYVDNVRVPEYWNTSAFVIWVMWAYNWDDFPESGKWDLVGWDYVELELDYTIWTRKYYTGLFTAVADGNSSHFYKFPMPQNDDYRSKIRFTVYSNIQGLPMFEEYAADVFFDVVNFWWWY